MGRSDRCWLCLVILVISLAHAASAASGFVTTNLQLLESLRVNGYSVQPANVIVASFFAEFDYSLFSPSACKPDPTCTRPTILPCCDTCHPNGTRHNGTDCFCPEDPYCQCLDSYSRNSLGGHLRFDASVTFVIGLSPDGCQDVAVAVSPSSLASIGPDGLVELVMCSENTVRPLPTQIIVTVSSIGPLPSGISFTVTVLQSTPSVPLLLLPLGYFLNHLNINMTLSCPGNAPVSILDEGTC